MLFLCKKVRQALWGQFRLVFYTFVWPWFSVFYFSSFIRKLLGPFSTFLVEQSCVTDAPTRVSSTGFFLTDYLDLPRQNKMADFLKATAASEADSLEFENELVRNNDEVFFGFIEKLTYDKLTAGNHTLLVFSTQLFGGNFCNHIHFYLT